MKKLFVLAFAALSLSAFAQHVTPLEIEVTDLQIDSLRALYQQEPMMYRASLEVVAKQLAQDAEAIKEAKEVLKEEQRHAKEMETMLKEAGRMLVGLKKSYEKENGELKTMQKVLEKQQKTLSKQARLNESIRTNYQALLEAQQKELGYCLREVSERSRSIADMETALQNAQSNLQAYQLEVRQKAAELTRIENIYKERVASLKAEQKVAKAMK